VRGGKALVYLTLVLAILVLLNLPLSFSLRVKARLRDQVAPLRGLGASAARRLSGVGAFLADAWGFHRRQENLAQALTEARAALWRLQALEEENRELRRLVGFASQQPARLVLGEVVARGDVSGWWETLTLNRGWQHGIATNMPVVTAEGLVGRTVAVSRQTCEVLLLSDPTFKVAARVAGTEGTGIVRGRGMRSGGPPRLELLAAAEPVRMDYVSCDVNVVAGAAVQTSGLGGLYPPGIPVGRVLRVARDPSGLYQRADLEPAADLAGLKYVFVMLYAPEG